MPGMIADRRPVGQQRAQDSKRRAIPAPLAPELPPPGHTHQLRFMLSSPATTPVFWVGLEALPFLGFSALGLRISLLDFFWLLAMIVLRRAVALLSG